MVGDPPGPPGTDPPDPPRTPEPPGGSGAWEWREPSGQRTEPPAAVHSLSPVPPVPPGSPGDGLAGSGARTGQSLLRPRTVSGIVDETFTIVRRHWRVLLPLCALVMIPVGILSLVLQAGVQYDYLFGSRVPPSEFTVLQATSFGSVLLSLLAFAFLSGALARAVSELCLGRSPTWREAGRFAAAHLGRLVGVTLLLGVALIAALVVVLVAALFHPLFLIGLLPAGVVAVIAVAAFAFAPVVVVVEGTGAWRAMGRSARLSRGMRGKVLGTILLMGVIQLVVRLAVVLPFSLVGLLFGFLAGALPGGGAIGTGVGEVLAGVVLAPLSTVAVTLVYFDARVRKEAFDLAVMAQELGSPAS